MVVVVASWWMSTLLNNGVAALLDAALLLPPGRAAGCVEAWLALNRSFRLVLLSETCRGASTRDDSVRNIACCCEYETTHVQEMRE